MHIATRQYKTTLCTHYKGIAVEEEGGGAGLACVHARLGQNKDYVARF